MNTFYLVVDPDNVISESNESNNIGSVTIIVAGTMAEDLSIFPSNISFTPPNIEPGTNFTVNAVVNNAGSANIVTDVAFYGNDPAIGGTFIGKKTIIVPALGTQIAQMPWTLPAGVTAIFVVVDPDNVIPETSESNNIAYKYIISALPDLVVTSAGITSGPSNPTPRSKVTITAIVSNYGATVAQAYLKLYDGAPEKGGILKGGFYFPLGGGFIKAGGYDIGTITTNLSLGEHELYVIADPDNVVQEFNEGNNRGMIKITITNDPATDLSITSEDITFSPAFPLAGQQVNITANVHNSGSESVYPYVSFYNGKPFAGGQLISRVSAWFDQESSKTITIPFTMPSGIPEIYVVVDDDNRIQETDENNNTASRTIDTYRNDLSVATKDISLNPVMPDKGDTVSVEVAVQSRGLMERTATLKLYEGNVEDGRLLGSQDFVATGNHAIPLSFPGYTYPGKAILTAVIENISPAEEDLTNNQATAIFGEHIEDGASNEGTDFWIAWPPTYYLSSSIIIQSKYATNVSVSIPVSGGAYKKVSAFVFPESPAAIPLYDGYPHLSQLEGGINNKAIHITSDKDVSVIFHTPVISEYADDSYLALPPTMFGTEYYFLSYVPLSQRDPLSQYMFPANYTIIAAEDNTNIAAEGSIINLNRGQTYHFNSIDDLSGTHIKSDKPIGFIAGTTCSFIPSPPFNYLACDSIFEYVPPVSLLGTDHYTAPLYSPKSSDVFRVLAVEDGTEITVKDKYYTKALSLNKGQWNEYENELATHIVSNKPIMVAQFAKGKQVAGVGDPFQMTIIPNDKLKTEYRYYTHGGYEEGDYLTVIAPQEGTTVMLDGGVLDIGWSPLPDSGSYLVIPSTQGEHVVTADKPVAVYAHGYRDYGSYGYPAGFAVPIANLRVDPISANPSNPSNGQLVELTATLTNDGNKWAKDVVVKLYNGDPQNGGVQIGDDIYFDIIYPKETKTVTFIWDSQGYSGTNNIYIIVDPLNTVNESNETDNLMMVPVVVTAPLKPDPAITAPDITLSKGIVNEGEIVTLSARIRNRGSAVGDIPVSLYLGNPETGGVLLERQLIRQILPLNGEVTLNFILNTLGYKEINDLIVVIDPENSIDELIESNNRAVKQLMVNRKKLSLEVVTDKTQYQANSDVGINVYINNESMLPWTGTGEVYIEDTNNQKIAHVATFTVDGLKPLGIEGWHYRVPMTVTEPSELNDAIATAHINFNSLFSSLGISGKTIDLNSIRVYESDNAGNFLIDKNARIEKDAGFDIVTNPSGNLFWHVDGITPADNTRYFYLYFDVTENGIKQPPLNTALPQKGKLVAFSGYWGDLYIVKVNTDGTFGTPILLDTVKMSLLEGITLTDFNNDGFPDIISGDTYGDIYLYQNKADGSDTFLPKNKIGNVSPTTISNNILKPVTSGDYNNDGNLDLILNISWSDIYLFLGNGDGTFIQKRINSFDSWNNPYRKIIGRASADFNNDGNIDLVVGDIYGIVSIVFGNGKGDFGAPVDIADIGNFRQIYGIAAKDLDNDGHIDVIVSSGNDGIAHILKGKAVETFEPPQEVPSLRTTRRVAYDIADFNGDGNQDVIAAQYDTPGKLFYFEGNDDGTFKAAVSVSTPAYYATSVSFSKTRMAPEAIATVGVPERIEGQLYQFLWNTGSTLPGSYKVHVTLSEGQGVIAEDYAPFEILPDIQVDSKVVTDKISYKANETVTLISTITSLSKNAILENLNAKITISRQDTVGSIQVYTETKTIPLLTPGQFIELKTYWNTGQNPSGTYNVSLEVTSVGQVISTSSASFQILDTSSTGDGLVGTISANPSAVQEGEALTLNYSITNKGNSDIPVVTVKVLIVDPETQTIKTEFSNQYTVNREATITEVRTISTVDFTPKTYMAILQAEVNGNTTSLAHTNFEVRPKPGPSLEITKTIPDVKNILVWLNYPWQSGQNCPDRSLIEKALKEAEVYYYIVLDKKDFETELRNPYYTDFLILGDHNPIEDHFSEELREQVYAGKGFISSLFNRQNLDADVFGIKFTGQLSGSDYPVELLKSEISDPGIFQSSGRALKVEAINPAEVIGWIVETTKQGTTKYPGIIKQHYGEGKVLFYAFDFGMSTGTYTTFAELLKNSLNHIQKPLNTTAFHPEQLVPVEIKVKSLGGTFDLKITETYPEDIKIYDPSTEQWITDNPWIINEHLDPNETKTILYYVLTPDKQGTYTLETEVGYMENGTYNFYQNLSVDIIVDKDTATINTDIITALNAFSVSGQEKAKVNDAVRYIMNVQNRVITSEQDIEKNIQDILKAIDSLLSITSITISNIRLMMDELLGVWESRWYY